MIYYLTKPHILSERALGKFTIADTVAAELAIHKKRINTKIISQIELLKLVDDGVMPSNSGDIIFVKFYNAKIISLLKVMRNREFKIINSYETTKTIREVQSWTTIMQSLDVPIRKPFNGQVFAMQNFDRTRGFGQGFEDFVIEYAKEHNLKQFIIRPRYGQATWVNRVKTSNIAYGYSVDNIHTFDWTKVDLNDIHYFIIDGLPTKTFRVPVVASKIIREACLETSEHFIDNLHISTNTDVISKYPEIELYAEKAIVALNLEIGFIDFHLINNEIRMIDVGNLEQHHRSNPFYLTHSIVNYLVEKHES